MNKIVYFKICDSEAEYGTIQPCKITKYKFINTIIKKIHHYKFIMMSKYNMIEKLIENKRETYVIYMVPRKNEEKVLRNINNAIIKMTNENTKVKIILSKQIKHLIKTYKGVHNINKLYSIFNESIENKAIYRDFLHEIIKSILKLRKETCEEQSMYILMNSNNIKYSNLLNQIIPNYKMTNIITQNINEFKTFEKNAEENFEPISVLNNKRKSIAKAKYIINIDFEEKDLMSYCINRTAIIFNINKAKISILKNFDGIIINNININEGDQEYDIKDEYIENGMYSDWILKAIENHEYELEGNNGKIENRFNT